MTVPTSSPTSTLGQLPNSRNAATTSRSAAIYGKSAWACWSAPISTFPYCTRFTPATSPTAPSSVPSRRSWLATTAIWPQGCNHITVVFDKGNNSKEGFESFTATPFHFVGSLVPSQHPDLLAIPHRKFRTLTSERSEGVEVYRTPEEGLRHDVACVGHLQPPLTRGPTAR